MGLMRRDLLAIYHWMVLARLLDSRMGDLMRGGSVPEGRPTGAGREAVGVGACYGLRRDDIVALAPQGGAARLVRGITAREMAAAALGRATGGAARGRHGARNMGNMKLGIIPGAASTGSGMAVATGAALACRLNGEGQVVLALFEAGAAGSGVFHESLNCAALCRLPIVFLCETDQNAPGAPAGKPAPVENVADRAAAYGMPGTVADGYDVLAVHVAAREAIERARAGEGPSLLECTIYRRWDPEDLAAPGERWPSGENSDASLNRCPIRRFREHLLRERLVGEAELAAVDEGAAREVEAAIRFALDSPHPGPEELFADVYAPRGAAGQPECDHCTYCLGPMCEAYTLA